MKNLILFFSILLLTSGASAQTLCSQAQESIVRTQKGLVDVDLLALQARETRGQTPAAVQAMNDRALDQLECLEERPGTVHSNGSRRVSRISRRTAQTVIDSIDLHPVVGSYQSSRYEKRDTAIGFCFGRATYVDLIARRMGVQKDSIRKLWVVGPMRSGGIDWAFHVTTLIRGENGEWLAIDNFPGRVLTAREWVAYFQKMNREGNLRAYVTAPEKFSASLGTYSRVQLGLDLPRNQDWYSHYFRDLMQWMKTSRLDTVGLSPLKVAPALGPIY